MKVSSHLATAVCLLMAVILLKEVVAKSDDGYEPGNELERGTDHDIAENQCTVEDEVCDCDSDCCSGLCRYSPLVGDKVCQNATFVISEILGDISRQ